MENKNKQKTWIDYKESELSIITPLLLKLGFELDKDQPHTIGERYLMQAMTTASGKKLILLGKRKRDGVRVVIKATRDKNGKKELQHERKSRDILHKINFAYQVFLSPDEILFEIQNGYTIAIYKFIEQESTFLARPIEQQFTLALKAFKAQESAHATTYRHRKIIKKAFETFTSKEYIQNFDTFKASILSTFNEKGMHAVLEEASTFLHKNKETIDQYGGFLTHTDFVPHNFRISGEDIYLLDHSSIRFGNKYEGWARFLNFMTLYNPELEKVLLSYVHNNRTKEEHLSLKLMRVYRLGEIISYYTKTLEKSSEDLYTLNFERIEFWRSVLEAILKDETISPEILEAYKQKRDSLRSEEEKKRQIGLH